MSRILESSITRTGWVVLAALAGTLAGLKGGKLALPVLQAALIFPLFLYLIRVGEYSRCVFWMCSWAGALGVAVIGFTVGLGPDVVGVSVFRGVDYRDEMFRWIQTGIGREGRIRDFLPEHLIHALSFCLLTALTLGFAGLVMGSVLMNYMSFYVGSLLSTGGLSWQLVLMAWPPWAALRVVGFVCWATALTAWVWRRWMASPPDRPPYRGLVAGGLVLLAADIVLKWLLASSWQIGLKQAAGF